MSCLPNTLQPILVRSTLIWVIHWWSPDALQIEVLEIADTSMTIQADANWCKQLGVFLGHTGPKLGPIWV